MSFADRFLVASGTKPGAEATIGRSAAGRRARGSRARDGRQSIRTGTALGRVLCAVDGSAAGYRAIKQAIAICPPDSSIDFVGPLPTDAPPAEERRLRMALDGATRMARAADRPAASRIVSSDRPSEVLLPAATGSDVLVIAATDQPDEAGLGRLATEVAHRCPRPLLLARRSVGGDRFPTRVLLASDGSPGSWYAAGICAEIAVAHGARFDLLRVTEERRSVLPDQVREQIRVLELVGAGPESFLERPGDVPGRICQAAINDHASLIVLGRGSTADRSRLGTVAESVAHRAGCSVLLAGAPLP